MEHNIRMIGLDLDGTLLTDKKELTPRTREALVKAIQSGVTVLVATGRPWMGVPEELRSFPGMCYALTSNGARVLDTRANAVLIERLIEPDQQKKRWKSAGSMILFKRYILTDRVMPKRIRFNW